jgi:hypothetical protein
MHPKTRPRKKGQSLCAYAETVVAELHRRTAAKAKSVDAIWKEVFESLCYEGQYVREVSPAAIVIYQYYFSIAVAFLRDYPDKRKHEELVTRVKEDLAHHASRYLKMQPDNFTQEERDEGSRAFGIIKRTLLSIA